jgi:hypothetical protein
MLRGLALTGYVWFNVTEDWSKTGSWCNLFDYMH